MSHVTLTLVACDKWFKKKFVPVVPNYVGHEQNFYQKLEKVAHKFSLSQVKPQVVPMSKCDLCVTGHTPGRINRNGTVFLPIIPE